MHKVASDEIFHFYLGDPVRMLQLDTDGEWRMRVLGSDILGGQEPQVLVRRGIWQGSIFGTRRDVCPVRLHGVAGL